VRKDIGVISQQEEHPEHRRRNTPARALTLHGGAIRQTRGRRFAGFIPTLGSRASAGKIGVGTTANRRNSSRLHANRPDKAVQPDPDAAAIIARRSMHLHLRAM
jgi:hypothetical protein